MRLVKISKRPEYLWEFIMNRLPASLRAIKINGGERSLTCGIEVKRKNDVIGYLPFTLGIATVGTEFVDLKCHELFSLFEGLIKEYEQTTGKEVTFYVR